MADRAWEEQPLPGLEPATGALDARYSRWLGACTTCRAAVLWTVTAAGHRTPVNVRPDERGNLRLTLGHTLRSHVPEPDDRAGDLYLSHFVTCPQAKQHRKARP